MSREPTAEQIEAVARAIYEKKPRWVGASWADLNSLGRAEYEVFAIAAIAAMNAEPLTSTPEPSTTETRTEGPISQDPPPGFEYEYRPVRDDWRGPWASGGIAAIWNGGVERRLVGPPERIEEE